MDKVGSIRVEQPRELTPRRDIVNAREEGRDLPNLPSLEFGTASKKRDNSVTVAREGVAQALDSDFLAAQPAVGVMDQTNLHIS